MQQSNDSARLDKCKTLVEVRGKCFYLLENENDRIGSKITVDELISLVKRRGNVVLI